MTTQTIMDALGMLASFEAILAIALGTLYGILIGAIPGLGSVLGITVILPFTFVLDQTASIALLLGTYCGSVYGGSIPAILLNTPGTPQSAATLFDGYPMARRGQPGLALGWATLSSAVGGIIACVILAVAAPLLARFGLRFGPIEYFALGIFALTCIVSVARESAIKGIFGTSFGLFLALIGQDPISGVTRYDFGIYDLSAGLALIPVLVGLFALSEVMWRVAGPHGKETPIQHKVGFAVPPLAEVVKRWKLLLKSSLIGTWIGSLPGVGATAASLVSYAEAKRSSPDRDKFGTGTPDGIIASEASNNAVTAGALVPTLALGVPGDPVTAVMLGAMTIQNVVPGPSLFVNQPDLVMYLFMALFAVNVVMFVMGISLAPLFSRVLRIPEPVLMACVIGLIVVGTYSVNLSGFDLVVLFVAGLIGFAFRWLEVPLAPVVIGFVLSPMIESSLRRGLILTNDSFLAFFTSPIALVLFAMTLAFLAWPTVRWGLDRRAARRKGEPT
ncbi:tripartite tricarboxylate transporter permease [Pontitalea aquivivens]|uniref:tripartite tricarboxylate transporter permease n=1 Tax=Pontitalea aquivivens TaxID=3388663 RepID=UPI0039705413